ncbi:hypothetical protein APHAL10511_005752 [Amanita phalloides]|nr:hypothetical protein APHAL10511_005752 [Amanita phalloides]
MLLALPPELIDAILAHIDRVAHLTAFALASKQCAHHVIPRHTQYRFVRTSSFSFHVWAHLALNTGLARNIREVQLYDKYENPGLDRWPNTSVQPGEFSETAVDAEARYMHNIRRALVSLDLLTTFVWSMTYNPTKDFKWEFAVLDALVAKSATLRRLFLAGRFARYTLSITVDPDSVKYPGWRFINLTTLCLRSAEWVTPNNAPHLEHLLSRNPDLEHLDIPMEFSRLANCRFPRLKRLKLTLTAGAPIFIDRIHIQFLSLHPTIEDLVWYPIGNDMALLPGILPRLKRLSTDVPFAQALYANPLPDPSLRRSIECLNIRAIPSSFVASLEQTPHDRTSLRKLVVHGLHHDDKLERIPILFPNIIHLQFPSSITGHSHYQRFLFTLEGWLKILSQFQHLEVFRGAGIWETLRQSPDSTDYCDAIANIARVCPNLRQIDDMKPDDERGGLNRLVIIREATLEIGGEGESARMKDRIRCQRQPPREISVFDIFSGAFE